MVSQAGQQYKAWIKLDFDVQKDRFGSSMINQYTDPAYGFDLSKVLDKFEIKELMTLRNLKFWQELSVMEIVLL